MHLHASATWFIMTKNGLTRGAGGKQHSCKKIKKKTTTKSIVELSLKETSRQAGRGDEGFSVVENARTALGSESSWAGALSEAGISRQHQVWL